MLCTLSAVSFLGSFCTDQMFKDSEYAVAKSLMYWSTLKCLHTPLLILGVCFILEFSSYTSFGTRFTRPYLTLFGSVHFKQLQNNLAAPPRNNLSPNTQIHIPAKYLHPSLGFVLLQQPNLSLLGLDSPKWTWVADLHSNCTQMEKSWARYYRRHNEGFQREGELTIQI